MIKKVVVVEFTAHESYLRALLEIFRGCNITLLVTESYQRKFMLDSDYYRAFSVIAKPDNRGSADFFRSNSQVIRDADVLFLNTLCNDYQYLSPYVEDTKVALTVHNLNDFSGDRNLTFPKYRAIQRYDGYKPTVMSFLSYLMKSKLLLLKEEKCKQSVIAMADVFCVYHQSMLKKVESTQGVPAQIMPFKLPEMPLDTPTNKTKSIGLAMIGNVEPYRKNYLDVISALDSRPLSGPVNLYIIGSSFNSGFAEVLESAIEKITNNNFNVIYEVSKSRVSDDRVKEIMKDVHFLVGATKKDINVRLSVEQYGETKATGCDFDAMSFNRLILNNSDYTPIDYLADFHVSYKNYDDFVDIINKSFDHSYLADLYSAIDGFSVEALKLKFAEEFCAAVGL